MSDFENNNNYQEPAQAPAPAPAPVYVQQPSMEDTTPISAWGYVGYMLLFSIPCVGLICLIIFACGGSKNVNLRNFARGQLILWVIGIILCIIMVAIMGSAMASLMSNPYMYY